MNCIGTLGAPYEANNDRIRRSPRANKPNVAVDDFGLPTTGGAGCSFNIWLEMPLFGGVPNAGIVVLECAHRRPPCVSWISARGAHTPCGPRPM